MAQKSGALALAWRSKSTRNSALLLALLVFCLMIGIGSYLRQQEQVLRETTALKMAHTLASSVISSGGESDEIILKLSDLLNVEAVNGVKLLAGSDIPLSVGENSPDFPDIKSDKTLLTKWQGNRQAVEVALRLEDDLPFDWISLNIDCSELAPQPIWGTLINWVAAPVTSALVIFASLWLWGQRFLKPLDGIQQHLKDNSGKLATTALGPHLIKPENELGLLARQVEAMRTEIGEAKAKSDAQARFLHETPYPLLRCSVNRKVLYANSAARIQKALFGDDSKEFVAPTLAELVRKAFYESKPVFGDIRCNDQIFTFRAVPVLEAGYVNLYGEVKRHMHDDI